MSLSSPEPALHYNVVGRVTKKGLLLPLRVHLEEEAECKTQRCGHYCCLRLFTFYAIFIERKTEQIREIMVLLLLKFVLFDPFPVIVNLECLRA